MTSLKIRCLLALVAGAACIVAGFYVRAQHQPYEDGVSATATVSGARERPDPETTMYSRVFTFTALNGREITVTESESSSTEPDIGSSVEVSYPKFHPRSARIVPEHDWLPYVLMAAGVPFALAGLAPLVRTRARRER